MRRICAEYTHHEDGPLLIVVGGLHGNEPAGLEAILIMQKMLDVEPITNPSFKFHGAFVGMIGNKQALKTKERFITQDLNRLWSKEHINKVCSIQDSLTAEDLEVKQLFLKIHKTIKSSTALNVYLLDLHTVTASGGIFSLPFNTDASIGIAEAIHAPIIVDIHKCLKHTMCSFFQTHGQELFPTKQLQTMVFEAGQHDDPLSVNRAVAAIVATMRHIGCVSESHIEHAHDKILLQYSKGLPEKLRIKYAHSIKPGDAFRMQPGYRNFQRIRKGELLAVDVTGEIRAKSGGRILMPLYQKHGQDGFFLAEVLE